MDNADRKYLHDLYYNPAKKSAFAGVNKLWKFVRASGRNITRKSLNEWLSEQDVYTSHHPIIRRFACQKVITRGIDDVWDADLMDMSKLANDNDGYTTIGVFIDIFSRYLYVVPMKNKTSNETLKAIKQVLIDSRSQPETFRSDAGKEFLGKEVKEYLANREIYQQVARNEHKANYAERVIRTIKGKIFKYLYANKSKRYIDVLQDIVSSYNNSYHSGIKCAPSSVNKNNQYKVWIKQYLPPPRPKLEQNKKKKKIKFPVKTIVRISNVRTPFSRGFGQTFSEELFVVKNVFPGLPVTYRLKDLNGEEVKGLFYEPELVKVMGKNDKSTYSVEKIVATCTRKGKKEFLVKWKGYSNKFNSWEPENNLL